MIKAHLNQVYPKVIIFCYIEKGEEAMIESEFGGIIINDYYITKFNDLDYNSSSLQNITEEQKNDIAVGIFLKVIHEASELKKYALSEEENNSSRKIFNKNKKIVTLKQENDYVPGDNKCEYILRSYNIFLNKGKRKREKDVKDNEIEDNKNEENKTEDNNTHNKNKHYSPKSDEKRNKTRMERVNDAIKRVSERFNITKESCLRKRNLMEILNKLNINDPYFRDVSFLISYINIKI